MAKVKFKFEVTVEVDENEIVNKYPNYRFNFNSPKQLADSVANDFKFCADTDMSKNGMKEWGYSINVKPIKA
jgi:hypothetical protein